MTTKTIAGFLFITFTAAAQPVVIKTTTLIDGKGHVLRNQQITVEGTQIKGLGAAKAKAKATYDLSGLTVLPGFIDTHVHLGWFFNAEDRLDQGGRNSKTTPQEAALYTEGNAYATLMGGFTTVQSLGSPIDVPVRDLIAKGLIPGPRVITSYSSVNENTGTPDQIREALRKQKASGADVAKLFATKSIRDGGAMSMSIEQINAACGEAKALGLRGVVHAHSSDGATAAINAGCTSIEHGTFIDDKTFDLMVAKGVFYDPNFLVLHNYLENKPKFLGIGNYNEEGFGYMEKALPLVAQELQKATAHKVKIVLGTDAVAGSHGRNGEEFIYRVKDGKQDPMAALTSGTSTAAESLGMGNKIGSIAEGMEADLVALDGNPLEDITAVRRVVFVMKGGKVYKNVAPKR
jgi:imidazolonepropionase-like amidohydrolase